MRKTDDLDVTTVKACGGDRGDARQREEMRVMLGSERVGASRGLEMRDSELSALPHLTSGDVGTPWSSRGTGQSVRSDHKL